MAKLVDALKNRFYNHHHNSNSNDGSGFTTAGDPQQLVSAISAGRSCRNVAGSFANAQHTMVQRLLLWASREPNAAIRDVVHQISELDFMWLESQTEFKTDLQDFERTLTRIVDIEEESVTCLVGGKSKKPSRQLLANVQNSRVTLQHDPIVQETLRENEVQKLLYLKKSLSSWANAYVKLGDHCSVIFEALQRIAKLLPDAEASVSECPQLSDVQYSTESSRAFVNAARAKLSKGSSSKNSSGQFRRCNCQCGGRRHHRSNSRVKRRCSEPIPYRPTSPSSSESEYEDDDDKTTTTTTSQRPTLIPAPPPYNYPSAPALESKAVSDVTAKLEEVMLSHTGPQPNLYPPVPVPTSTWSMAPPPYGNQQR